MIPSENPYLFVIIIWAVYFIDNCYLNYKMKIFLPSKEKKELLLIPLYTFFFFLAVNIFCYYVFRTTSPTIFNFNGSLTFIFKVLGIFFCFIGVSFFIYANHFEKSFPSCLTIKQGKEPQGIYNYMRHPSYIVFFLLTFGTAFYTLDILLFIFSAINHVFLYFYYMVEENYYLKELPHYKGFFERTNRFLPKFKKQK